jgi:hypothetical protein
MTALLLGLAIVGQPPATPPAQERVGRVLIVGNTRTADRDVLRELQAVPGQPVPSATELRRVEIRLLLKYHRRFDIGGGKWPTVEVIREGDSEFRDVRVSFPER